MDDRTLSFDGNSSDFVPDVNEESTLPHFIFPFVVKAVLDRKVNWIVNTVTGEGRTYADFEILTRSIGSAMYKKGLRKGDTLLYMTYDMFFIHALFVGIWRANGMIRASYPEDDEETLLERVIESRVGWILCDPEDAEKCLRVASQIYWGVEVIVIGEAEGCTSIFELLEDDGSELPVCKVEGRDPALILCTSGTTGKSKGAVHTHSSIIHMIAMFAFIEPLSKVSLIVSKGTHITGSLLPLSSLISGGTALVMAKIKKDDVFRAVQEFRPSMIFGFPTFLLFLVHDKDAKEYDFSSLDVALTGGAPVTQTMEEVLQTLPNLRFLGNNYGLSEGAPLVSELDFTQPTISKYEGSPIKCLGRVCPGVMLQIRHLETEVPLGPYEQGEIWVKSKVLFHSYYKKPEETKKAFQDGWFKTGDVAYYDDNRYLYLIDRIKEIFKYYNNHISPTELEEVILNHPDVAEACVVGIPDPAGGDRIPRAFVKVKPDCYRVSPEDVMEFANERLPDYKRLRGGLFILDDFPKGKTGKVSRQELTNWRVPTGGYESDFY